MRHVQYPYFVELVQNVVQPYMQEYTVRTELPQSPHVILPLSKRGRI